MESINLNNGEFLITDDGDEEMKVFLKETVSYFFMELSQYINDNDDLGIVHYGTERTMASLFVSGALRRDRKLTGVQEYGIICTRNNREVKGRPDVFMKCTNNAIWIECKYFRDIVPLQDEHWDIPAWLEWDKKNAFAQLEIYYNSEKSQVNKLYKKRFLVTLNFKLIE